MKVAIVGLGSVGRRHLRNLESLGRHDCVLLRTGLSTLPDDDLAHVPVVRNLDALLRHQPDAAIIATPTALHLDTAIPLARAGCHLLIEKPVSHSMEGVADLREAAGIGGAHIMVAFQYRHHPGLQAIRRRLTAGDIGRVVSAHACYGDYLPAWHPWEDYRQSYSARADLGGGAALTLCHPFDYLVWMLGPVSAVTGTVGCSGGLGLETGVEDTADGVLEFAGGVTARVHLNFLQQPPSHTLTIVGTGGVLTWDQGLDAPPDFDRNDMFLAEMQTFLDVCAGTRTPEPTLDAGVHVLNIALALRESARIGRTVSV
jgi:predicted dehydrogenase